MTRGWRKANCEADTSVSCTIYPIKFVRDSSSSNIYLANDDDKVQSRYTPEIIPVDSVLTIGTFSNRRTGVDIDLQLLAAPMGTQLNQAVTVLVWSIRNKRFVTECFSVSLNANDKIALFMSDFGTNPIDPRVTFWFQPLNCSCIADSDNLSQHFPQSGGTTTT